MSLLFILKKTHIVLSNAPYTSTIILVVTAHIRIAHICQIIELEKIGIKIVNAIIIMNVNQPSIITHFANLIILVWASSIFFDLIGEIIFIISLYVESLQKKQATEIINVLMNDKTFSRETFEHKKENKKKATFAIKAIASINANSPSTDSLFSKATIIGGTSFAFWNNFPIFNILACSLFTHPPPPIHDQH